MWQGSRDTITIPHPWQPKVQAPEEESSLNFDTSTLHPTLPEISEAEVRQLAGQVRQLVRGGDFEGALRGCLETPVYNGVDLAKEAHLQMVLEVLQSTKAVEMTPLLQRIYVSDGGSECLDVLMKYLYKDWLQPSRAANRRYK
ncbi:hypothetical protein P8C59_005391 [Phyllachora maydis]|uniref:Actin-related protein 2/3 complex subunit 5 n=1 Tax=Phyllachora maydis TaxID=1825666 RepID=A0AAD9I4K6_9PEZI|nr:hypothetical protein P8C59_005391 [Phyllachora maydis]